MPQAPSGLVLAWRTGGWPRDGHLLTGFIELSIRKAANASLLLKPISSVRFLHMWLTFLSCVVFRVSRDGTASREDPKEKREILGPWYDTPRSDTRCAEGQRPSSRWLVSSHRGRRSGTVGVVDIRGQVQRAPPL